MFEDDESTQQPETQRSPVCPGKTPPLHRPPISRLHSAQWLAPPGGLTAPAAKPAAPLRTPAPAAGQAEPLLGSVLGSFRLVRKLGSGGMGTVYLGEHTVIGNKVAVKFLHEHFVANESLVQRFLAEARSVNLIGHENIINIFDIGVLPPQRYYLLMEYLEGSPLSAMTGKPAELPVAVSILTQVCDALQAAHAKGVVHRDLKPENLFLVRRDRMPHFVKVLDFGVAKLLDSERSVEKTSLGTMIGTPEYMAPEQWYGHAVDGRTDLYALGLIAYELLTGRPPFGKGGLGQLLHAHLMETPKAPHEVNPEVPMALSQAVMRAMAKPPEARFRDAAEMREALEHALVAQPAPPAAREEGPPTMPSGPTEPGTAACAALEQAVRVVLQPGTEPVTLAYTSLCRGGVFLCTEGFLPPLRSRLTLTFERGGQRIPCAAEVVSHMTPAQASAWRIRPGFAVQFLELPEKSRVALGLMAQGKAPQPAAPKAAQDDDRTEALLVMLRQRRKSGYYALLAVPLDASFDVVRKHARTALRFLETIAARPLSARQAQELGELRSHMNRAAEVLGHPRLRIEHDAWRANYAGVARCISSGFSATEVEVLQARFLADHPGAEAKEQIHASTAVAWESQGRIDLALVEYEKALTANPLRLTLQQRYWALKQRGVKSALPPPPAQVESFPGL